MTGPATPATSAPGRPDDGVPLNQLHSPCAVLDVARLRDNAARFRRRARELGVALRPHIKTHKSVEVARVQHGGEVGPITVSTLAEARAFVRAGFGDVVWAVPAPLHRLGELTDVARSATRCAVVADHPDTVAAVAAAAMAGGVELGVFVKVDCGAGRAGVNPDGQAAEVIARQVMAADGLVLRGLLTHAGQAYTCRDRGEIESVARRERDVLLDLGRRLGARGVPLAELSVGSTPTFVAVDHLDGISEVRPGNYAFFDAFQVAMGSCSVEQVAFTVLATVIAHYPERAELLVDAGALALSKDPGPVHVDAACGFGMVVALDGRQLPRMRVVSLTQEHGLLRGADRSAVAAHPVGSHLRIIPNHSCLAAACFDRYHVLENGRIVDEWTPARGW